jgi:pimeloyl-ACP methyl ester carboxylesterase
MTPSPKKPWRNCAGLRYIGLFRSGGDMVLVDQRGSSERGEILSVKVTPPSRAFDEPLTFSRFEDIYREVARTAVAESETANIDLRGYTVLELADDVDDLRRALGYDKISLVGGSFGTVSTRVGQARLQNELSAVK